MDQDAIKVQPFLKKPSFNGSPEVLACVAVGQVVSGINRDSSKIPMYASHCLECEGDPLDSRRSEPENRVFEFCCF